MADRSSRSFAAIALACTVGVPPLLAQQPDRPQTEAMARRAGERLQALQREADRLASEERSLLNELRRLEVERLLKAEELKQLDAELGTIEHDLAASATRAEWLERSSSAGVPQLRARLVEL